MSHPTVTPRFDQILMVAPDFFDISYAINAHMLDAKGHLKKIDKNLARKQWKALHDKFVELGFQMHVLPGHPELPDMVFAANQVFPFHTPAGQPRILLSQMRAVERKPEVEHFKKFFEKRGYSIESLPERSWCFEGNGDALLQPEKSVLWGGYGPRTDFEVYTFLKKVTGFSTVTLELKNPNYYHLDTCLAIFNSDTAAYIPDAFTPEGCELIEGGFGQTIILDPEEAQEAFVGNAFCGNGHDIVVQSRCPKFRRSAESLGFRVHEVDTSEFIKAGGSVFCLKMAFPSR